MDPKAVAAKLIDEQGLKDFVLVDVLDGIVKVKLDEMAAGTEISLDDALVALIYPVLRDFASKALDEQLAKLQA